MTGQQESEYVLGTDTGEIGRLSLQHSVWRADAAAAWQRAGFTRGQTLLDLGCGPGFATLDLAELVGSAGRVIAVDQSDRFLAHARESVVVRGLEQRVEIVKTDAAELSLPPSTLDGAWIRWVLAFVAQPAAVLQRVTRALRPGASVAIHEYYDYRTWRFFPRDEEFEEFVGAVMSSWRRRGGEPDIGFALPLMLMELGLEIRHVRTIADVVQPQSQRWHWAMAFAGTAVQRLLELGDVTPATAQRLDQAIERVSTGGKLMATPGVIEVIASRLL